MKKTYLSINFLIRYSISRFELRKERRKRSKSTEPETKPAATCIPEVAKGKEAFDINCASCHGATGAGDGVAAAL